MSAKKITKKASNEPAKVNSEIKSTENKASNSAQISNSIITITLNRDLIQKRAYELSQLRRKYEDYVYIFTEADLKLAKGIIQGFGPNVQAIKVDKSKIPSKLDEKSVKDVAKLNFDKKIKLEDLQWYIAERLYVLENLK